MQHSIFTLKIGAQCLRWSACKVVFAAEVAVSLAICFASYTYFSVLQRMIKDFKLKIHLIHQ